MAGDVFDYAVRNDVAHVDLERGVLQLTGVHVQAEDVARVRGTRPGQLDARSRVPGAGRVG